MMNVFALLQCSTKTYIVTWLHHIPYYSVAKYKIYLNNQSFSYYTVAQNKTDKLKWLEYLFNYTITQTKTWLVK